MLHKMVPNSSPKVEWHFCPANAALIITTLDWVNNDDDDDDDEDDDDDNDDDDDVKIARYICLNCKIFL